MVEFDGAADASIAGYGIPPSSIDNRVTSTGVVGIVKFYWATLACLIGEGVLFGVFIFWFIHGTNWSDPGISWFKSVLFRINTAHLLVACFTVIEIMRVIHYKRISVMTFSAVVILTFISGVYDAIQIIEAAYDIANPAICYAAVYCREDISIPSNVIVRSAYWYYLCYTICMTGINIAAKPIIMYLLYNSVIKYQVDAVTLGSSNPVGSAAAGFAIGSREGKRGRKRITENATTTVHKKRSNPRSKHGVKNY